MTLTYLISESALRAGYRPAFWLRRSFFDVRTLGYIYAVFPYNLVLQAVQWLLRRLCVRENIAASYCQGALLTRHDFIYWDYGLLFAALSWLSWSSERTIHMLVDPRIDWFVITRATLEQMLPEEAREHAKSEYWRGVHEGKRQAFDGIEYDRIYQKGWQACVNYLRGMVDGTVDPNVPPKVERD